MSNEHLSRLQAIFNSAIDGIITINTKGIMDSVNPAASKLFGYSVDELIGQSVNILMPAPHNTQHDEYIKKYTTTGQKKIIGIGRHLHGKRKDGSLFPIYLSVSEVKLDSGIIFTGIIHDTSKVTEAQNELKNLNSKLEDIVEERTEKLTEVVNKLLSMNNRLEIEIEERNKIEEALRLNEIELKNSLEREKELSKLKSKFVSMASHEFKTPLSTIMSSASLIKNYTNNDQQDKSLKHIDKIQNSIRNLNAILNDFLSIEKLEESKTIVNSVEFNLISLIEEIIESFEFYPHCDHNIFVESNLDSDHIVQDKVLLEQVIVNLLSNACKYSKIGTDIRIVTFDSNVNELTIQVIDKGMGIPNDEQQYMFERFYRAKNVQNIPGTGLGLNIIQYQLELMNGSISFQSTFGEGSTFTVIIPKILKDED